MIRDRRTVRLLVLVTAVGAVLRAIFVFQMALPRFDPWRHLQLIRNLQAGRGFTLFDAQPYIWYTPLWYTLAAAVSSPATLKWFSAALSLLAVPIFSLFLLKQRHSRLQALAGGLMMAVFGPVITFTCSDGGEPLALLLLVVSLLLSTAGRSLLGASAAGLVFGLSLMVRLNFVFCIFLFLPLLGRRKAALAFLLAAALPAGAIWVNNDRVIRTHEYLFTWDGLATESRDYDLLSTLVVQDHPAVREAARRLSRMLAPVPEWLVRRGRVAWGTIGFMVLGGACLLATRNVPLILAGFLPLLYFNFLDPTSMTNFFRHYLPLFPVYFMGFAEISEWGRRWKKWGPAGSSLAWILALGVGLSGAAYAVPAPMTPLEMATPPPSLLSDDHYMVNSSFYHPESLAFRFPDKRFIGMPLFPDRFEDFARRYRAYGAILWRLRYGVQGELLRYLRGPGGYKVAAEASNRYGIRYLVLKREAPPRAAGS
ncbi:MAG: hypothetical protein ACE5HD_11725 [Acidobacteriota bacterium]